MHFLLELGILWSWHSQLIPLLLPFPMLRTNAPDRMITSTGCSLLSNSCQQIHSSTPVELTVLGGRRVNIYSTLQKLWYLKPTIISICEQATWKNMALTVKRRKAAKQNKCGCFLSDVLYSYSFYKTLLNHKIQLIKIASLRDSQSWEISARKKMMSAGGKLSRGITPLLLLAFQFTPT